MLFKSVFLIKRRCAEVSGAFHRSPFRLDDRGLMIRDIEGTDDAVERGLHEFPDLPLPADHHAEDTGHHTADGQYRPIFPQVGRHRWAVS